MAMRKAELKGLKYIKRKEGEKRKNILAAYEGE